MKKIISILLALIVTASAAAIAVSADGLRVLGDYTDDGKVTSDDAIFLLRSVLFPESYSLSAFGDFDGNGEVGSDDAIFLLRHVLFPDSYVLKTTAPYSEGLEYYLDGVDAWITGPGTFDGEELNIPPEIDGYTVVGVDSDAFQDAAVTSVTLPAGVTAVYGSAFIGCESLVAVYLPEGIAVLECEAFEGCLSLPSAVIPAGVTSIEDNLFGNCYSLASVAIHSGVTHIGDWAFSNCDSLVTATVPDGVTYINDGVFNSCDSLKSVYLPAGITCIGGWAFDMCEELETIYFAGTRAQWESIEKGYQWDNYAGYHIADGYNVVCADD
ncbi:MAG: leucine-rich repeat protein [Clostridia bacterium]|nr:leucine-rich repeat protein [Clostridia bacterium]